MVDFQQWRRVSRIRGWWSFLHESGSDGEGRGGTSALLWSRSAMASSAAEARATTTLGDSSYACDSRGGGIYGPATVNSNPANGSESTESSATSRGFKVTVKIHEQRRVRRQFHWKLKREKQGLNRVDFEG